MIYSVKFHADVAIDINEAYAFYEKRKSGPGEDFLTALRSITDSITLAPENYGFSNRRSYREAVVKGFPFIVVFRVYPSKAEVFVASVHHERKHPARRFR